MHFLFVDLYHSSMFLIAQESLSFDRAQFIERIFAAVFIRLPPNDDSLASFVPMQPRHHTSGQFDRAFWETGSSNQREKDKKGKPQLPRSLLSL